MKVTYLCHSGFCVEMPQCVLIFDYWKEDLPVWEKSKPVYVFVSHGHDDHYNKEIFQLKQQYDHVVYFLSQDIKDYPEDIQVVKVRPNKTYAADDVLVKTYFSTDMGVAYVVEVGGKRICHMGDLNWWHWNGEEEVINQWQKDHYCKTIQKMKNDHYDVVFGPPLDPRLEENYELGMNEFLKNCSVDVVFPMHLWEKYDMIDKYVAAHALGQVRMIRMNHRNEVFEL